MVCLRGWPTLAFFIFLVNLCQHLMLAESLRVIAESLVSHTVLPSIRAFYITFAFGPFQVARVFGLFGFSILIYAQTVWQLMT